MIQQAGGTFVQDRLGSNGKYLPYGEERNYPALGNDQVKFATYTRDSATGLDYADQRYYASTLGRFLTPDPSGASDFTDPGSLNLYGYTGGDPVNFNDPEGLDKITCGDVNVFYNGVYLGTPNQILDAGDDVALLATAEYTESAHGPGSNPQEMYAIGDVIMNRWQVVNGYYWMFTGPPGARGRQFSPDVALWGQADGGLASIIENPNQFGIYHRGADGTITLTDSAQTNLDHALGSDPFSKECTDLDLAIGTAEQLWSARNAHQLYQTANGLVPVAFNSPPLGPPGAPYQTIGNFGSANVFYGVPYADFFWLSGQSVPIPPSRPRPPRPPRRRHA
jgi:RHS repeat-associated protein